MAPPRIHLIFFFNDTATTEIYTLSLHDALPICHRLQIRMRMIRNRCRIPVRGPGVQLVLSMRPAESVPSPARARSEEHTSELQSPCNLVCRLLLEKKKTSPAVHNLRHCSH